LNRYVYDPDTSISDIYCLTFYYDRIEFDYGQKEKPLRKTLKTSMMDRCAIIMTDQDQFTMFFNMNGNAIDYEGVISSDETNPDEKKISYQRTAPLESQSFYSTVRLVIKIIDDNSDNITDNQQIWFIDWLNNQLDVEYICNMYIFIYLSISDAN